ncbi:hypothetical protein ILYODFUR_015806 [Ilyodon furcidens]|uniref:Uncharacterized protein n=1 Tax=Ilyodon furcidens TaxID=33524 RepID=A0ABV0V6Y6_9TELE
MNRRRGGWGKRLPRTGAGGCIVDSCGLSLPEEWRGVRDEALSELSGIKGGIFVHAGGFIGGNKTQEGALEMARRTLQAAAQSPANGSN